MLVIVAPGQGAQTPGFLAPWLEDPTFADRLNWLSAVAGIDLAHYGTEADAETIRDTADRPAAAGRLEPARRAGAVPPPGRRLRPDRRRRRPQRRRDRRGGRRRAITAEQAMVFVRERGKAMAEAAAVTPTGMTAVLGGDRDEVLATLDEHGLTAGQRQRRRPDRRRRHHGAARRRSPTTRRRRRG